MLRSMYTAITSLNLHQNYLDVIADNLANANTTGFKASRVNFQDQVSQIMSYGTAPTATSGGVNPTQIGLGVTLGYISPIFTQGMLQSTGRNTDLAIQGDGFFVYGEATDRQYSREGSLELDANGYLVNQSTGMRIQGWQTDAATGKINVNQPISNIFVDLNSTLAKATTKAVLGGNLDSETTFPVADDDPDAVPVPVTIGVYDSLGNMTPVTLNFTRVDDHTWTVTSDDDDAATASLVFGTDGQLDDTSDLSMDVSVSGSTGADAIGFTVDLTKLTMFSSPSSISATSQDGLAAGSVSDVNVTQNTGEVYVVYSNGLKEELGQLSLAHFTNPTGLVRAGHNLFKEGLNSGIPQIGTAASNGRGAIATGYLEGSNVDMAQEFTNMILAERGFQASSRVITTSDEILQELVNLKR